MKKNKKILIGVLVLISALIILPFFLSIQNYLDDAERVAKVYLGVPVTIKSGYLTLLPSPRIVVNGVIVGKNNELSVESLDVIPDLSSIFSTVKIIDIKIDKPIIKKAAAEIALLIINQKPTLSKEDYLINLRHIEVSAIQVDWGGIKLPALKLDAMLSNNKLTTMTLESLDGAIGLDVKPEKEAYLMTLIANKWVLPIGLPLHIDQAKVEMQLSDSQLSVRHAEMALYGGMATTKFNVFWRKDWRVNGRVQVRSVSVQAPTRLVSKSVYLSGQLSGDGGFSSSAKDAGSLIDQLNANFKFKVQDGVLHGLDLIKIASLLTKQKAGGETEFDVFAGLLNVKERRYHLQNLEISSGLLSGDGDVKIKANGDLAGAAEVSLKRSANLVAVPLSVSGTVEKPVILPSRLALAGAVAGTAILGPGVGTSVGIKAAGALDKIKGLFHHD